jgi:hypothetical protein
MKGKTAYVEVNCLCICAVELKFFVLNEVYKDMASLAAATLAFF